ncbi:MAG: protealysin inhibitor emfourin [Pseudolysinimonas sp.]
MAQRQDDQGGSRPRAALSILVVRTGGFAGLRQQWQVEPDADTEDWIALVRACPWGAVGRDEASRDRFVWRIEARLTRVVHTASVPDALLVGPWRALVDRVQEVGAHG